MLIGFSFRVKTTTSLREMKKEDVKRMFDDLDKDHSGTISEKELSENVNASNSRLDTEIVQKIRNAIKQKKSGEIRLEELFETLCG
ncbi:unnamed protein product [Calicophoron daubneyi]|uniref:EF-hand domain-containing protein n=1 Tax=Calicophoron daubneyi TaxID=300641 RepID=A0AAV2TC02_CALDB